MKEFFFILALALFNTVTNGQNLNCNFDNDNICAWMQVKGSDNADWQIRQGPTPSMWTGPQNDHTTNTSSGYYIYYEANNGKMNDKAQLQSPRFSVTTGKKCLSFWYYMYGPSVNSLNVYLKTGNTLGAAVFHRERTQGQKWNQATITITNKRNIQIVIEAVRGHNYLSDIGVDDILFTNGACGQAGSVTPPPEMTGTVTCNFETSDICGYKQSRGDDQFDWKWASGATPTRGTGPPNDHTQQSSGGHYMLMESNNHRQNQKCRLLSPITVHGTPVCLQFYYYMYGINVNRLSVYTKTYGRVGVALWSRRGNQGPTWQVGQITLNRGSTNYQVVFEAVRGNGNLGDIAIDDVVVHSGRCPSPGSCDFEKGLCTWTNSKGGDFDWITRVGNTNTQGTGPTADHTLATGQIGKLQK